MAKNETTAVVDAPNATKPPDPQPQLQPAPAPATPPAPAPITPAPITSIEASIFPPVRCPLCETMLQGHSATGSANQVYIHGFEASRRTGKVCELKGKKFKAPTVRLEIVP